MSIVEAALQKKTEVGNSLPTMPQTLLFLAKLYNSGDTDRDTWLKLIESHHRLLMHYLAAVEPDQLDIWADSLDADGLRRLALTFLNYPNHDLDSFGNQAAINIARSLALIIAPDLAHRAALCSALIGTDYEASESEISHALRYAGRDLDELYDTPLLTRIVAIASQCSRGETKHEICASLLSLDQAQVEKACEHVQQQDESTSDEDDYREYTHLLALINLKAASAHLNETHSSAAALTQLASLFFGTSRVLTFMQNEQGWSDGIHQLSSHHSLVDRAASRGKILVSDKEKITVVDEEILNRLSTGSASFIPVCINRDRDCCAAVIAVGQPLCIEEDTEALIPAFLSVARATITADVPRSIDLDELEQFAREVIHEANNPLSTVQNYLKILSLKLGPEHDAQSTIDSISTELYRTADVVRGFGELGKKQTSSMGECHVNQVLADQAILFERGHELIQFNLDLDADEPVATISASAFTQVISNLLKNAVEALAGEGGISIRSIGSLRQNNTRFIEVSIKDTGPGIKEDLEDIFARGVTSRRNAEGGQGLAIVKEIIDNAGGFVSFRSRPGDTEFRLTLPQT